MSETRVYFARSADGSAVKIGFSRDPVKRMKELNRNGHPILIGTIDGGAEIERGVHNYFASFRMDGEWFRAEDDLLKRVSLMVERGYVIGEEIAARVGMRYIHAKIDEDTYRGLVTAAKAENRTLSSLAAYALSRFIAEKEK